MSDEYINKIENRNKGRKSEKEIVRRVYGSVTGNYEPRVKNNQSTWNGQSTRDLLRTPKEILRHRCIKGERGVDLE